MLHMRFLGMSCPHYQKTYHKSCYHLPILSSTPIQVLISWGNWNGHWKLITSAPPLIPVRIGIISKGITATHRFWSNRLSLPLWDPILSYSQYSSYTVLPPRQPKLAPPLCVCMWCYFILTLMWLTFQQTRLTWSLTDVIGQPWCFLLSLRFPVLHNVLGGLVTRIWILHDICYVRG